MHCHCSTMFTTARRLDGCIPRLNGLTGGPWTPDYSVEVVHPPFWAGKPAYQVQVEGMGQYLRASAREASDLLRRLVRQRRWERKQEMK